jgi:hypothetical protein
MEKTSWTDYVRTDKALQRVNEGKNALKTTKNKEGSLNWSYLAYELSSKTPCLRKYRGGKN